MLKIVPRGYESRFWRVGSPVLAVVLTGLAMGLIFLAMGRPAALAVYTFFVAPLLQTGGLEALAVKAAPLILMGAGLCLAYRANLWNIGAEGQFTLGAIAGGGVAPALPEAPAALVVPAMLLAGLAGGMAGGGLVAWLRVRFNASEILTSLMLTYIVQYLLIYLVTGPWRDPMGFGFPQTAQFSEEAGAPRLVEGTYLHVGVLLAPLVAAGLWFVLERSALGFQFRVLGHAPRAARFAGFREARLTWVALLVSGGLAGLAGLLEVAGTIGQLTPSVSPGYGFAAIIVAFLGRLNPIGMLFSSLLMALLYLGGESAQMSLNLPQAITQLFQGMMLFFLLACDVLILYRPRLNRRWARRPAPVAGVGAL